MRNDRIGDLVLTLPAFEAVRRHWPRAHVAALVSPYAAPLLAGTRYVDEVIVDDPSDRRRQLARRLQADALRRGAGLQHQHAQLPGRVAGRHSAARLLGL